MTKYNVYGSGWYSVDLGTYEAEDEEAACKMADMNPEANWMPTICHQCSREVELSDLSETAAYKIEGSE